jgi:superfamily II DNA or RNA helicase/predicted house-cleaning noncanonical NTP pyrophosphatase (MazG superfamily)/HKD family nuclease
MKKDKGFVYQKLVRDKIPEIIKSHGKECFTRVIEKSELHRAIGAKILEEAYELYSEWQKEKKAEILKESADMLEIILMGLAQYGLNLKDLLNLREKVNDERGSFKNKIFLESVGRSFTKDEYQQYPPTIVFNPNEKNYLLEIIKQEFKRSYAVNIASAFYSPGAINLLLSDFENFIEDGGQISILLSTMGNINRPEYLEHLSCVVPGIQTKIFHPKNIPFDQNPPNFHLKIWLFHHFEQGGSVIIGSSNFTKPGFLHNHEWNYYSGGEINLPFKSKSPFKSAVEMFNYYWEHESVEITNDFLSGYKKRWTNVSQEKSEVADQLFEHIDSWGKPEIPGHLNFIPNEIQKYALDNLNHLRKQGTKKAAIIAATGVGKTYLAAFDFHQYGGKKLLYIAHRESILKNAMKTFQKVLSTNSFGVILSGKNKSMNDDSGIFAMIQTLSKSVHLQKFPRDYFNYIVIDEFHHSEASSYRKVLNYFEPEFLLGLTATPERMDGRDVLRWCDFNVAYEVRLLEAIDKNWLSPFQYFAIYDETDYEQIKWTGTRYDEDELTKILNNDTRTEIIARNFKKYLPSSGKSKALAFCSSVAHARYTAKTLTENHNIEAVDLTGKDVETERILCIRRLQDNDDPLQVICTVDIFNEGIDIPDLTHVLFLRPTQSFTLFLQQLGRGLRKFRHKEYLVVLDFVGNYRKSQIAPLALSGYNSQEEFADDGGFLTYKSILARLPVGCYLSPDIEVKKIWDSEIRRIFEGKISIEERLKSLYLDIKNDLGIESPVLLDFIENRHGIDPYKFIRHFNGWLRVRLFCEDSITDYEKTLIDTPGEAFLYYLETGLNPVKSYKMVILKTLLKIQGTSWDIKEMAKDFLDYFLKHPEKRFDYTELSKFPDPLQFKISTVVTQIKNMPLKFLSNTEKDYFILDSAKGRFHLKPEIHPYWKNNLFQELVSERVDFLLTKYFLKQSLRQAILFDANVIKKGFEVGKKFAEKLFEDKPLQRDEKRKIELIISNSKEPIFFSRSADGRFYEILYPEGSKVSILLKDLLKPFPKIGEKCFSISAKDEILRIEI